MVQDYSDGVPGAYVTKDGVPDGCTQLPVYGHFNHTTPWEADEIVAFFLIDSDLESALFAQPRFGKWHLELYANHTFAVWLEPPKQREKAFRHRLHEEVWKLAGRTLRLGDYLRWDNFDEYDCRLKNIVCIHGQTDRAQGLRVLDHSTDRVALR